MVSATSMPTDPRAPRRGWRFVRAAAAMLVVALAMHAAFAIYLGTRPVVVGVDAVQRYRDSLPKPAKAEDAAWPAYREALIAMGHEQGSLRDQAVRDALGRLPGDEQWGVLSTWLEANQPAIAAARAASKRPVCAFPVAGSRSAADEAFFNGPSAPVPKPVDWRDRGQLPMLALTLPQLSCARSLGRVLAADMFRAIEQGDGERATQDLEAIMALSIHVAEGRILIGDLVAMAIRRVATASVTAAMEWKPQAFTDEQLRRMQVSLRSVPAALECIDLTTERLMFEDAVQRFYSDNGQGDGWFVPTWQQMGIIQSVAGVSALKGQSGAQILPALAFVALLRPIGSTVVAGRRATLEHYDAFTRELEAACAGSPREVLAKITPIDARQEMQHSDATQRARWFMESLLLPALGKAVLNAAVDRASREAACAAIAAELFHRTHARWPASAADLAAFNGGRAPADPWAEGPIRMAVDNDGFRMWSVGRDGKDDGGVVPASDQPGDARALSSTQPNEPAEHGLTVDWVWFAPRGNLGRWRF